MTMAGRLPVICSAIQLTVVVVVNSASLQSADVISTARQQHHQPCVSSSGKPCPVKTGRQAASVSSPGPRRRRQADFAASTDSTSHYLDEDRQKRRAQQKSLPPQQNVTVHDDSVAEALALAADVGRGPPPPPLVPPRPPPVQPPKPSSAVKPPVSSGDVKPAASASGGGGSGGKGTGSGDAVNVMLALGCEAEPCQHAGVCYTDAFNPRGFSCRCTAGFYGDVCEYGRWRSFLSPFSPSSRYTTPLNPL